ncbi:MAG TPA: ATP-binding protein [Acidimicrobiales bacterium]
MPVEDSNPAVPEEDLRLLARSLARVLTAVHRLAFDGTEDALVARLRGHLGTDPAGLPVVSQELPPYQLVDVHVALDQWIHAEPGRSFEIIGISGDQRRFHPLSELLSGAARYGVGIGPVDYVDLADSPDSTRSCVRFGLYLLSDGTQKAAALLRGADPHGPIQQAMIEVLAENRSHAHEILSELRRLAVEQSVLRGQVLALGPGEGNQYGMMRFVRRPGLQRGQLVLPDATLAQIERHVIGIAAHRTRLQAAGQHLKRGILLYGPPGTGKTHTIRYLLSQLRGVTSFILSGQALMMIGPALGQVCGLARLLQPSLVILEDVDVIAPDRSFGPLGVNPILYEVLNQIDGLGDDVDVTFLLTTNRVDILERALSERPGRVDAAVEIAPPDSDGRRALFRLYGSQVGVDGLSAEALEPAVSATEGRTATYIREVVRRATLAAAETTTGPIRVDGDTLATAAAGLLDDRATLTRSLLGGVPEPDAEPPLAPSGPVPTAGRAMSVRSGWIGRPGPAAGDPPAPFGPEPEG